MQISQEVINDLVNRIKIVVDPQQVILFGSAARGLMAPDSDLDARYPGDYEPRSESDYHDALSKVEQVFIWAKNICESSKV